MGLHLILCLFVISTNILAYDDNATQKVLSRKKRYLVFPEGSSLQLVYCMTMPVLGKSNIFTIGGTAALAWELPHDPYQPYRKPAELLHRNDNFKPQEVRSPTPQKYKKTYPAYTKTDNIRYSTIYNSPAYKQAAKRKHYYNYYNYNQPVTSYVHPVYHQVHRRSRRDLYGKIEKLFTAQRLDGKACLLKAVCEVSQIALGKGSFMEEIVKAVFRVKPHEGYADEDEYDGAMDNSRNCSEMYPSCQASVWNYF